jgi:hypothetical protein
MRKLILALFCLQSIFTFGQASINHLLQLPVDSASKVDTYALEHCFYIPFDFANNKPSNKITIEALKEQTITHIDFVYTSFKLNEQFQQNKLNKKRLLQLKKKADFLLTNNRIQWNIICQTACKSPEEGLQYYHGFIIHYRPPSTLESTNNEIDFIKKLIENRRALAKVDVETDSSIPVDSTIITFKQSWDDVWGNVVDTIYGTYVKDAPVIPLLKLKDTTISTVLDRNNWNSMTVVTDVTASMADYTSQLLVWFEQKFEEQKIKHFVFFNDGNNKSTILKRIGKTGGIYHIPANSKANVLKLLEQTMLRGNGGDAQENDIESLLYAEEFMKTMDELVLIADNSSDMRDFQLMANLGRPVRIIICGNPNAINPEYLMLARMTKGSVHTVNDDIIGLENMYDGENINIGDGQYKFDRGMFYTVFSSR